MVVRFERGGIARSFLIVSLPSIRFASTFCDSFWSRFYSHNCFASPFTLNFLPMIKIQDVCHNTVFHANGELIGVGDCWRKSS